MSLISIPTSSLILHALARKPAAVCGLAARRGKAYVRCSKIADRQWTALLRSPKFKIQSAKAEVRS
eukprot:9684706-Alexandrium_andersonii.AAC.1